MTNSFSKEEIFEAAEILVDKFPDVHPEIVRNIFVHGANWAFKFLLEKKDTSKSEASVNG